MLDESTRDTVEVVARSPSLESRRHFGCSEAHRRNGDRSRRYKTD